MSLPLTKHYYRKSDPSIHGRTASLPPLHQRKMAPPLTMGLGKLDPDSMGIEDLALFSILHMSKITPVAWTDELNYHPDPLLGL